ncbi:hypothetical protein Tco_1526504 [Tanacetum coccineum]
MATSAPFLSVQWTPPADVDADVAVQNSWRLGDWFVRLGGWLIVWIASSEVGSITQAYMITSIMPHGGQRVVDRAVDSLAVRSL